MSTSLPLVLMKNVHWSFSGKPYQTEAEFVQEVLAYHHGLSSHPTWEPEQIVLRRAEIEVQYICWRDGHEIEPRVRLRSPTGDHFTAAALLFALHNAVVDDLRGMDHHFFEGLHLLRPTANESIPCYHLRLGS
jgi:hypothetical protein